MAVAPHVHRATLITRRALLAGASGGAWAAAGCAVTSPQPVRVTLLVLAPESAGRVARMLAWNRRFEQQTGAHLEPAPLPAVRTGAGAGLGVPPDMAQAALDAVVAGGTSQPAIAWMPFDALPRLALRRAVRPLEPLARAERTNLKVFMPAALQPAYGLDAQLYALPEEIDAGQLYFNRQHVLEAGIEYRRAGLDFERPRNTWAALRQTALDLQVARVSRERLPWHPGAAGLPLELWGWLNGGGWLTPDGRRATFAREENVAALEWLVRHAAELGGPEGLRTAGPMPSLTAQGAGGDDPEIHPLLVGRVSMYFDSTRLVSAIAGARPGFPLGFVESPRRRDDAPLMTWSRVAGYALLRGAPDAGWPALQFLVSEDAATVDAAVDSLGAPLAGTGTDGPPRLPAAGRRQWYPAYTGQLKVDRTLARRYRTEARLLDEAHDHGLEQLRHARFRERSPAAEQVWPLLEEARRRALQGTPVREALETAGHAAQAALDAAWGKTGG